MSSRLSKELFIQEFYYINHYTKEPAPIRLADGGHNYGRLEVYHSRRKGTVCDDSWSISDVSVVCPRLGFSGATQARCCAAYGQECGPVWMDDVRFQGEEETLAHYLFPDGEAKSVAIVRILV